MNVKIHRQQIQHGIGQLRFFFRDQHHRNFGGTAATSGRHAGGFKVDDGDGFHAGLRSGLPIVASDIEGYHDVVENGNEGLLVPPKSPRQLSEAIVRLARSSEERSRMAAAGRNKALQYDWKIVTDRVEAVYREVLGHRSS